MTIKETIKHVAAKVDKVVSGFDDEKEKKNPGELEVNPHVKAVNNELPTIDHSRDAALNQVINPAGDQVHQPPGHKQSRDHPIADPNV